MIYCPKCGTANRDGSRFCNECGEPLGTQTYVKCPECGALNPSQNLFCSECRARLLPPVSPPAAEVPDALKGLSQPTTGVEEEGLINEGLIREAAEEPVGETMPEPESDIPAWLSELGATLPAVEKPTESDLADEASEIPDWLRDLRASLPAEPEQEPYLTEDEKPVSDRPAQDNLFAIAKEPEPVSPIPETEGEQVPDLLAELASTSVQDEPEPTPPIPEAEDEEQVPDWLAELASTSAQEAPEPTPPISEAQEEEQVPDWLAELASVSTQEEPEPEPTIPEAGEEEQVPDWLAELASSSTQKEPEPAPPISEAEEKQVPSSLFALAALSAQGEPEPPVAEGEEAPDWLAELRSSFTGEAEPIPLSPEVEEEEALDQLAELQPSGIEPEPEPATHVPSDETEELPDWLTELRSTGVPVEAEPLPATPEIEAERLPDWLVELEPTLDEEPIPELPASEVESTAPAIPEWLQELQAEADEGIPPPPDQSLPDTEPPDWLVPYAPGAEGEEPLAPAEIPAWLLALKPTELRKEGEVEGPAPTPEQPLEETGLLAGIQGALPVEMVIAQPRAVTSSLAFESIIADTPHARLFSEIVSHPSEAAPREIAQAPTRALGLLPRWILYLALIVAVSLPLLLGKPIFPRTIEPTPSAADLYDTIESLGSNAPVLVAFDYDPTSSGEMNILAEAMVGHLMDQGARIVTVSLLSSGPATAQPILDKAAAARPGYVDAYGQRYANLGFVPGQATAVRLLGLSLPTALLQDFQGTSLSELTVMEGLTSTQSFDLILELAATQDSVRWWVEQAGTPYGIPLAAGVSASVDPLVRPYYESEARQLKGLVSGIPGAAMYEALLRGQSTPTDTTAVRLDSLLTGHMVFVLALLLGGVFYLAQRGSRRES